MKHEKARLRRIFAVPTWLTTLTVSVQRVGMKDRGISSSMTILFRYSMISALFGLGFGCVAQAQSAGGQFTTASGKTLMLPPIKSMECPEMDKMLARIDSTRYRENAPTPHNKADAPLFEYELLLAEENYNRCVLVRKKVTGGIIYLRRPKSQ
jgi:hypothetical protein